VVKGQPRGAVVVQEHYYICKIYKVNTAGSSQDAIKPVDAMERSRHGRKKGAAKVASNKLYGGRAVAGRRGGKNSVGHLRHPRSVKTTPGGQCCTEGGREGDGL